MSETDAAERKIFRLIQERFGAPIAVNGDVKSCDLLAGMLNHRTHRSYTDDPVDENLLRLLSACALSAPSKSDLQQADIIYLRDPKKQDAVADLIPGMPWIREAPVFLIFCGNGRRIRQVSALRGETFANDLLDAFFNAAVDAAIVMATFINAAEAAGLGCCPISAVRNHCSAINGLLEFPELVFPVAGLCLGYPDKEGHISQRLPLDVTTHIDTFDDSELEDRIYAYDRRRAEAMPASDRYLWSEAKAKQYSEPHRTGFGAYIRKKGFNLS